MLEKKTHYLYGILLLLVSISMALRRFYSSDCAVSSIIGQDFASGNFLLEKWVLSTQPYFTTDYFWHGAIAFFVKDPFNAAIALSVGFICFSWFAIFLLYKRIVSPVPYGTDVLFATFFVYFIAQKSTIFNTPTHAATVAFSMLAMFFFYRPSRTVLSRTAFALCAAIAMAGDAYAFIYMFLPLVAEVCFRWFKRGELDRDIIVLPVALAIAIGWAKVCRLYGYEIPGIEIKFVEFSEFPHNIYLYFGGLFHELSAWFWGLPPYSFKTVLALFFAGIIPLLFFCHYTARHSPSRATCFLLFSSASVSLAFLFSNAPVDLYSGRYLIGMFYNGIPLTALFLSKKLPAKIYFALRVMMICALLAFPVGIMCFAPATAQTKETQEIAALLLQKKLFHGYGEYWSTHSVALRGGGQITIAPIVPYGNGYAPYYWLTKKTWYTEVPATFIIWDTTQPESESGLSEERILKAFGMPMERLAVGRFRLFSYEHTLDTKLFEVRK